MKISEILEARYHGAPSIPIVITWATNYNGVCGNPDTEKMGVSYKELEDRFPGFDKWVSQVLEDEIGNLAGITGGPEQQLLDAAKDIIEKDGRFKVSSIRLEYDDTST